jgi:hypothetical protein
MPPKLTEEDAAILSEEEEERSKYTGIEDALALSMAQLHHPPLPPPGPPSLQTPPRPRRAARKEAEAWDPWPAPQPPALA